MAFVESYSVEKLRYFEGSIPAWQSHGEEGGMVGFPLSSPQMLVYHHSHLTFLKIKVLRVLSDNQRPLWVFGREGLPRKWGLQYVCYPSVLLGGRWASKYQDGTCSPIALMDVHLQITLFPDVCASSENLETMICKEKQHPRLCLYYDEKVLLSRGLGNVLHFSFWTLIIHKSIEKTLRF